MQTRLKRKSIIGKTGLCRAGAGEKVTIARLTETMVDWHLYLIRCHDGSLYTGITTDVARRLEEHQENSGGGAKYLRGRGPLTLVFQKKLGSRSLASGVESKVKKLSKARKEELIGSGARIDEIIRQVSSQLSP